MVVIVLLVAVIICYVFWWYSQGTVKRNSKLAEAMEKQANVKAELEAQRIEKETEKLRQSLENKGESS